MLTPRRFKLDRTKTISFLDELAANQGTATSVYILPDILTGDINEMLTNLNIPEGTLNEIIQLVISSQTGAALFWGDSRRVLFKPPFFIKEQFITGGYDIEPLSSLIGRDYLIGIILVRLGFYSLGLCRGEELIDHKTGTGLVHGRHRQGGSSSHRFEHRRKEQAYHFLERVGEHAREKFEPYARSLDYLVYGGARTTILQLRKQIEFLEHFDDRLLPMHLDIPEPGFEVLQKVVKGVWTSHLTEWLSDDIH